LTEWAASVLSSWVGQVTQTEQTSASLSTHGRFSMDSEAGATEGVEAHEQGSVISPLML
jgi:hypothetical protein